MDHDDVTQFGPSLIADLNVALDEAVVHGVRWDRPAAQVRVLLRVLSLPAEGPADPDPRRLLVLREVSDLRILLRRDRTGTIDYGPPVRLPDQQTLDDFFASLAFADSMYGCRALDDASPADDWPVADSLTVRIRARPATHCFYWFTECGRTEPGGTVGYCLEGLVRFETLAVQGAGGSPIGLREFAEAGWRWWVARRTNDPRVSVLAQRETGGPLRRR